MLRSFASLLVPGGLLLLGAVACTRFLEIPEPLHGLLRFAPSVLFASGALLGWRFRRSQMVLACLVLGLADWSLMLFSGGDRLPVPVERVIFDALAVLVPLDFLLLSLTEDRGIFSRAGLFRLLLILYQPLLVAWICLPGGWTVAEWLGRDWIDPALAAVSPVPQAAWPVFGVSFLLLAVQFLLDRNVVASGLLWALGGVLLALHAEPQGVEARTYLATAGLVLIVSQIESVHRLAFRDELTELPSRRALDEALLDLDGTYTVAMVDIDHFKRFNDTFGHAVGDQVLRMVAFKLAAVTGGGRAYRYGGEEFAVLFPGRSLEEATPHLEAVRATIEETPFTLRMPGRPRKKPGKRAPSDPRPRKQVGVTVSIGAAESGEGQVAPDRVIRAADRALFRAKDDGRNRVSA